MLIENDILDPELQYGQFDKWWHENNQHLGDGRDKVLAYQGWLGAVISVKERQKRLEELNS